MKYSVLGIPLTETADHECMHNHFWIISSFGEEANINYKRDRIQKGIYNHNLEYKPNMDINRGGI